jgi:sugar lactone lactonase YvrE
MKKLFTLLLFGCSFIVKAQIITNFAGGGSTIGDGGPATAALIANPGGMAFDKNGNLYIASGVANRVRKIDTFGIITTVAGNGTAGYNRDGAAATSANLRTPNNVALDAGGNLYIVDSRNHVIRRVDIATAKISTICGNGVIGSGGDGYSATAANLYAPSGICFDKMGNMYIADCNNHKVRKINTFGVITTFAGTGVYGYNSDGVAATAAELYFPCDVEADDLGNIYISDAGNSRVRKVSLDGKISTYVGNGSTTFISDGVPATNAAVQPVYISFDMGGNLYIADDNYRAFKVDKAGIIHTVAGTGVKSNSGDGGPATAATMYDAKGVAVDKCGNLYISVIVADRIRKVTFNPDPCPTLGVEAMAEQKISVYPNPAGDVLCVDNVQASTVYKLVNVVGAAVQQGALKQGNNSVEIAHLAAGVYVLDVVDSEGKRSVRKVV